MKIDNAATKAARKRHAAGVARLNAIFSWLPSERDKYLPPRRSRPESRRRRRKLAHESRRRNRA